MLALLWSDNKFRACVVLCVVSAILLPVLYGWGSLCFVVAPLVLCADLLRECTLMAEEMYPDEGHSQKPLPISRLPQTITDARVAAIAEFLEEHCPRAARHRAASWGEWRCSADPELRTTFINSDGSPGYSFSKIDLGGLAYLKREIIMLQQVSNMLNEMAVSDPQLLSFNPGQIIKGHRRQAIDGAKRYYKQIINSASTMLQTELEYRMRSSKEMLRKKMSDTEFEETIKVKTPST